MDQEHHSTKPPAANSAAAATYTNLQDLLAPPSPSDDDGQPHEAQPPAWSPWSPRPPALHQELTQALLEPPRQPTVTASPSSHDREALRRRSATASTSSTAVAGNRSCRYHDGDDHDGGSYEEYPSRRRRILDRDADFFQSRGRWSGVELVPSASQRNRASLNQVWWREHGAAPHPNHHDQWHHPVPRTLLRRFQACLRLWAPLLYDDWFHSLAYQRTIVLMIILFVTYSGIVVGFGIVYWAISVFGSSTSFDDNGTLIRTSFCSMDITNIMEALYFSLSTMTTIGYGVSDYYFGGCWTPLLLVLLQVCAGITFDALAVGLLFTRLSRGRKRGKSIVVSNQAVVQFVRGIPYWMFRVGELRRYHLMEASVRVYCIRHERIPRYDTTAAATAAITTDSCDNDHVVTASDAGASSPQKDSTSVINKSNTSPPPPPMPVDTTHFVTRSMALIHPDESATGSNHILMGLPQVIVHSMNNTSPLIPPADGWYDVNGVLHASDMTTMTVLERQRSIQDFWKDRHVEIVVLVEGTDELTGSAVQCRHSYRASNDGRRRRGQMRAHDDGRNLDILQGDVVWHRTFVPCVLPFASSDHAEHDVERSRAWGHHPHVVEGEYSAIDTAPRFGWRTCFGMCRRSSQRQRRPRHATPRPVCTVDFVRFHDTAPAPTDCPASPYVPSRRD